MEVSQKLVFVALAEGENVNLPALSTHGVPGSPWGSPGASQPGGMLPAWCVAAVLGGGRAAAASGLEGEKEGDSHTRAVVAGQGGCGVGGLGWVCVWSRSLTVVADAANRSKRMDKH